jgi:hypothetical protein
MAESEVNGFIRFLKGMLFDTDQRNLN